MLHQPGSLHPETVPEHRSVRRSLFQADKRNSTSRVELVRVGQVGPTCSIALVISTSQPTTSRTFSMTPAWPHRTSSVVSPGGNLSNIFGTIQTTGFGNANLFLMNPAGFLFGPNATVNVGGMVSFTFSRLSSTCRRSTIQCHSQYNRRCASKRCAGGGIRFLGLESRSDYRSRQPIVRHARTEHLPGRREHHSAVWRT